MARQWTASGVLAAGLVLLSTTTTVLAAYNCPLPGPEYPPPRTLGTDSIFQGALKNLTSVFEAVDAAGANTSYSIQVFSANPGGPSVLWERFRTAPNLKDLNSTGVKTVDRDTVYRLGSITKVFTVLAFLAEAGDANYMDPITKWIPELGAARAAQAEPRDPLRDVDWEDITIGALASQTAGIIRDYGILAEVTQSLNKSVYEAVGFPPLPKEEELTCGTWPLCNRTEFFERVTKLPPSYKPSATPAYSNIAYQLLAYALESIAKKPFFDILNDRVLTPLNLTRTYYYTANESVGIIPGTAKDNYWNAYLGDASPTGNMFASAGDLTTLGLAILKSSLVRPAVTRRWFKPAAFTSDFRAGISAPWGVRRIPIGPANPHRTITVFNKAGRMRDYVSLFTLIPEWNLGFTIMMAGNVTGGGVFDVADFLGETLLPAFDATARAEADARLAGKYESRSEWGNWSTLAVSTTATRPGLGVSAWYNQGADMTDVGLFLQSGIWQRGIQPAVRLYYTGLESTAADGSRRQAFKAVWEDEGLPNRETPKMFSTDCAAWLSQTGVTYGALPLDEFIFNIDAQGKTVSVENLALRNKLYKVS